MTTRRRFLSTALAAATPLPAAPHGRGSMLWDYIVGEIRRLDESRSRRLAGIRTTAALEALQREVRERLAEMWGPFPARTPLNARVVGAVERPDYVIEKILFESRPAFPVTAALYRPRIAAGRLPAVIFPLGHSDNGKAYATYQRFPVLMARNGFVCLTWDPVGQGERLHLWDREKRASLAGPGTREHSVLGKACYLIGLNLMNYRVWDAMRAIDYLETRPDVDPARIGCAGTSGGGMETLQLAPFETRIRAAAPSCAVATFRHKTEALLIADPEQNLYGNLGHGIDHPELLAAVAPRPLLIEAAIRDFVPIEGARRTFAEIRPAFALLGAAEKAALVETDDGHSFNQELREAAANWFARWLDGGRGGIREQPAEVLPARDLFCTETGQVVESPGGETVFTLNRKRADEIAPRRALPSRAGLPAYRREIAALARRVTRLDLARREDGIHIPVASHGAGRPVVLVAEAGKDDPALRRDVIDPLVAAGRRVAAIDVRGLGETRPHMPDKKAGFSWDEFFAYRSMELGRPLFGQRLRDVLIAAPEAAGAKAWDIVGVGAGALLAAYAAALEPRIRAVAMIGGMLSYRSILDDPLYRQPLSAFLPGVIASYEVRDILAAIAPRRLLVVNLEDARRRPAAEEDALRELRWTRDIYRTAGAEPALRIVCGASPADAGGEAAGWLAS